ncbi:hypothetical protein [Catenulispora subtropica]|uniref:Uncharacterized protein n=1 Tax=Catenulispora subtropica TaxID=450798 RepID=A0ABP5D225_9ACTN
MTVVALPDTALREPALPEPALPEPALPEPALAAQRLSPDLDAATHASVDAHEATRALTDTVLACRYLPAEIYQYAPHLSYALAAVVAAARALTGITRYATAHPSPDRLAALRQATADLTASTTTLRAQISALADAAALHHQHAALPAQQPAERPLPADPRSRRGPEVDAALHPRLHRST